MPIHPLAHLGSRSPELQASHPWAWTDDAALRGSGRKLPANQPALAEQGNLLVVFARCLREAKARHPAADGEIRRAAGHKRGPGAICIYPAAAAGLLHFHGGGQHSCRRVTPRGQRKRRQQHACHDRADQQEFTALHGRSLRQPQDAVKRKHGRSSAVGLALRSAAHWSNPHSRRSRGDGFTRSGEEGSARRARVMAGWKCSSNPTLNPERHHRDPATGRSFASEQPAQFSGPAG